MKYIVLIILFISIIFAETGGKVGFSYLKIGIDARAAAMGDAYSSIANDAAATYWNPAGLAMSGSPSVVLMHNAWLSDINHEFAAVQLFQGKHNIAFALNMISVDDIEIRETNTSQPDGYSTMNNTCIGISYARILKTNMYAGIQLKYLYEKYYLVSSRGFAFDIGIRKQNIFQGINGGISLHNIGKMSRLDEEATPLPVFIRSGLNYILPWTLFNNNPLVAVDFLYVFNDVVHISFGTEVMLLSRLNIRLGYVLGNESYSFTSGLGITFSKFRFSYAFVPFRYDFGQSHRVSVLIYL
jgi:hypothetical protein